MGTESVGDKLETMSCNLSSVGEMLGQLACRLSDGRVIRKGEDIDTGPLEGAVRLAIPALFTAEQALEGFADRLIDLAKEADGQEARGAGDGQG